MASSLLEWLMRTAMIIAGVFFARPIDHPNVLDNPANSPDGVLSHLINLRDKLYSDPNNETGNKVAVWNENMEINPEELGEYLEGDILIPSEQLMYRNGIRSPSARWPYGVIPYIISPYFSHQYLYIIHAAMSDYHRYTCIRFKPYAGENDFIEIIPGNSGCWGAVGRQGGRQTVNLQIPGCVTKKGTVIHELMHAVGFLHEQNRFERDQYVFLNWNNINRASSANFEKASRAMTNDFGVGYDYESVMHYSAYAFSRNGQATIIPRMGARIGQREGFSQGDIMKIRRMYRC